MVFSDPTVQRAVDAVSMLRLHCIRIRGDGMRECVVCSGRWPNGDMKESHADDCPARPYVPIERGKPSQYVVEVTGKAAEREPTSDDDAASRLVSDTMADVKARHAVWMADSAFVEWVMWNTGSSREEVLGMRCGMLDSYTAWRAGIEYGCRACRDTLRMVAGPGQGIVANALRAQADAIDMQLAHLASETGSAEAQDADGVKPP